MKPYREQSFYELLEVPVNASDEAIRAAYQRAMDAYDPDSVAIYSLVDPAQAQELRAKLKEALEVLIDPDTRELYDEEIGIARRVIVSTPGVLAEASHSTHPDISVAYTSDSETARATREAEETRRGEEARREEEARKARAAEEARSETARREEEAQKARAAEEARRTEQARVEAARLEEEARLESARKAQEAEAEAKAKAAEVARQEEETRMAAARQAELERAQDAERQAAAAREAEARKAEELDRERRVEQARAEAEAQAEKERLEAAEKAQAQLAADKTRAAELAREAEAARIESAQKAEAERVEAGSSALALRSGAQKLEVAEESGLATLDTAAGLSAPRGTSRENGKTAEAPGRKPIEIPPDAEFNGELLRRVREARGMTLQQVSDRTRISKAHLENVEADRYQALPAAVYLRGMVMSLAREIGLDPLKVAKSYLGLASKGR